jgi:translation initiation factor 3 subunit E
MLAQKLNMDQEAAERWIVNLIRNARFDAKIDSAASHVVMGTQYPSIYQQVIDKTKGLSFKTQVLANNLQRHWNEESKARS